jgi:hypothetical protein
MKEYFKKHYEGMIAGAAIFTFLYHVLALIKDTVITFGILHSK